MRTIGLANSEHSYLRKGLLVCLRERGKALRHDGDKDRAICMHAQYAQEKNECTKQMSTYPVSSIIVLSGRGIFYQVR